MIRQAIRECDVYQRNKGENIAPPGLLSPLPLEKKVWRRSLWISWRDYQQAKARM